MYKDDGVVESGRPWPPRVMAGAVCWVLGLELLLGQIVAQAAWTTPYSLINDEVSDLGVTSCGQLTLLGDRLGYLCSPLNLVYNSSAVLFGLLVLAGAILTWPAWPRRRLTTWGLVLLCIMGVGRVVAGANPENVRIVVHAVGALVSIPCGAAGILLLGLAVWSRWRVPGVVSVVFGVVGLVAYVVLESTHYGPLGAGGTERIAEESAMAWFAGAGVWLLLAYQRRRARRRHLQAAEAPDR